MTNVYTPPGVSVKEIYSPSVNPILALPANVCLVGPAAGIITRTDIVQLNGTATVTLPSIPIDATMATGAVTKVMDVTQPSLAPSGYPTADYSVNLTNHTIARAASGGTGVGGISLIPDGNSVFVTYSYTPSDYWSAIRLYNLSDVEDRFGTAWDSTATTINSPISYAAMIAFENGAPNVVCQPLFFNNTGVRQSPTSGQIAAAQTWTDNFTALRDYDDINIIIPIIGQSTSGVGDATQLSIFQALQDHIYFMKNTLGHYQVGLLGEDSSASTSVATQTVLQGHAAILQARYGGDVTHHLTMVSPSRYTRPLPQASSANLTLGGQYACAAVAGMIAARDVAQPLTRKILAGIQQVAEIRTRQGKNSDAAAGLMVIENHGFVSRIRHAITLDTSGVTRRELSIVRAKFRLMESVRATLEEQVIGNIFADDTAPRIVAKAIQRVLEALRQREELEGYSDINARINDLDPTAIDVRFSYKPAYPVNYINVAFSLDIVSGSVTIPGTFTVDNQGSASNI